MELVIVVLGLLILISVMYVNIMEYKELCKSSKEYAMSLVQVNKILEEKNDILESIVAAQRDVQIISDEMIDTQKKLLALYETSQSYNIN